MILRGYTGKPKLEIHQISFVFMCTEIGYTLPIDIIKDNREKKKWILGESEGGGQLTVKEGNGEQMCGMVTGMGSVIGCPRTTP